MPNKDLELTYVKSLKHTKSKNCVVMIPQVMVFKEISSLYLIPFDKNFDNGS